MKKERRKQKQKKGLNLGGYILKYWYAYLGAVICMVIGIALDMLSPQITRRIIDDVILGGKVQLLTKLLAGILIVGFGRCIFGYIKEFTFDYVGSQIACHIRKNLLTHIQGLSMGFFDKNNTGELMARVKDDVDRIWDAFTFVGMLMIEVVIHTTVVIFCMVRLSPRLSIIPLIAMPLVAWIAVRMERSLGKIYEDISEENAVLNTVAEENLAGVRTVKAFAREKYEIGKFLSHNKRYYELNMKQSRALVKYQPLIQFVTKLLPILVMVCGGFLVLGDEISLGTLGAFTEYSMNIVWPMEMLGWLTNSFSAAVASNKKLNKIYGEEPEIREAFHPAVLDSVKGDVEFQNVSLVKGETCILKDISFHLKAGKTLGIMGATGTGKTSVIELLERFYEATEGTIRLDGMDVRELTLKQLRSSISLVMQEVFLFSDTVNENISMGGRSYVNEKDILRAAEASQARQFIEKMDRQYETIVGERGVGLSGGQKQRISIARALAKHTPILVLDDSTSALDMETEHSIQKELNDLNGTTKIIIAHRISAVRNADEILVLEGGRIAERGTHQELLLKKGLYYETYQSQYGDLEVELCP